MSNKLLPHNIIYNGNYRKGWHKSFLSIKDIPIPKTPTPQLPFSISISKQLEFIYYDEWRSLAQAILPPNPTTAFNFPPPLLCNLNLRAIVALYMQIMVCFSVKEVSSVVLISFSFSQVERSTYCSVVDLFDWTIFW